VSTLRRSLAVLLDKELQLKVRRQSSGKLYIDEDAEARLTAWMDQHARVCWSVTPEPWNLEHHLISTGPPLALNIKGALHPFVPELRRMRSSVIQG
jgi:GIY-YIG catalytic domain